MKMLLGAHMSIAGGLHHAVVDGAAIGATTVQVFTANQRSWTSKPLTEEEISLFLCKTQETGMSSIMSHGSYLINLGSPKESLRHMSVQLLGKEIERCRALQIPLVTVHPGSSVEAPQAMGLDLVRTSLQELSSLCDTSGVTLLLETTAGQGNTLGASFEQIAYMLDADYGMNIGVCIDTCHIFAAGYDIATAGGLSKVLDHFDAVVGLNMVQAMHINDSQGALGSRLDRHLPLGEGMIGKQCFHDIMCEPRLAHVPKYLETPGGPELWEHEIAWLREQMEGE